MGPFELHAERLFERGYQVVPIIPGTKKPGFYAGWKWIGLKDWTRRYNGRASLHAERKVWGRNGAGIGVLAGPASGDLVGIDIDSEDPELVTALLTVLPPTEFKKTGAKGETRFYRGPGVVSHTWSIDGRRVVEIIGPGRQTVLPPTVHPDTQQPYRWLGSAMLEDHTPQELPELSVGIIAAIDGVLEPFGYRAPVPAWW
jgi:hypothetical protein